MFKNLSPNSLTLSMATLLTLSTVIIQYSFSLVNNAEVNASLLVLYALISFVIFFLIVRYFVAKYLLKKIKLIYTIIQKSKFGKSSDMSRLMKSFDSNVWKSVESDFEKWANTAETEIENLKKLEKYRKDFVGNISHELKTPLFSIQGYVHTLLDGGLEDKNINERFLRRAADNVERLITIVEDLEVISRLEAGSNTLDFQIFDLKKFIQEILLDFGVQGTTRNIKVILEYNGPMIKVQGDREKYRQVFNNLISNSLKYGKKGGQTTIELHDFRSYVLVEIKDNGIGIKAEHLNHLFDRFYRVDKSRSRDVGGSGLGLSIAKHIVEAHGQTIDVRSTFDEGSTFGFTIEKAK